MKIIKLTGKRYKLNVIKRRLVIFRLKDKEKLVFPNPDALYIISGYGHMDLRAILKLSSWGLGVVIKTELSKNRLRIINPAELELVSRQVQHFIDREKRCFLVKQFTIAALTNRLQTLTFLGRTLKRQTKILDFGIRNLERVIKRLEQQKGNNVTADLFRNYIDEGDRIYISTVANLIPTRYRFTGRRRELANDPVNVTILYSYIGLIKNVRRILKDLGFHTEIGYLHSEPGNFDNLALDISEEFYQPVIDRIVFRLFIDEIISEEKHFTREGGHLFLNEDGKTLMNRILQTEIRRFESFITQQAIKLKKHLMENVPYKPYIWTIPEGANQ